MSDAGIKLVIYDLDRTLWRISGDIHASLCRPPFSRSGAGVLVDSRGNELRLMPSAVRALDEWAGRKTTLSVLSANDFEVCREIMEMLGIWRYFKYPQIEWDDRDAGTCDKARLLLKLLEEFRRRDSLEIKPGNVLFIDDRAANIERLKGLGVRCVHFGLDIKDHMEIFAKIN